MLFYMTTSYSNIVLRLDLFKLGTWLKCRGQQGLITDYAQSILKGSYAASMVSMRLDCY